jgi:type IX secretion system PorP/SprF family membrane protein
MNKLLLTYALVLLSSFVLAQDAAFSQFYANKTYLNPGFVGSQPGITLSTAYRTQWNYVPGGFTTYSVTADIQEPFLSSGFGVIATKDTEGEGFLTTTSFGLIYGYIIRLGRKSNIHIGFQTNFYQKTVDWSKFTFSDQLHPVLGVIYPTTAAPILDSKNYADFDAGIVWRSEGKFRRTKTHNNIGFAVHHLNEPNESLQGHFDPDAVVPRRYTFHAGTMFEIVKFNDAQKRILYLSPNFKFDWQQDIKITTWGVYSISNPLYAGIFFQNKTGLIDFNNPLQNTNSIILTGGFEGRLNDDTKYTFGYSYDLNTTGLGPRTNGVHEVTLMVNFEKASIFGAPNDGRSGKRWRGGKNRRGRNSMDCYRFSGANSISIF